jgi:thioredoxin
MIDVTDETFEDEVLRSDLPVIVDFHATWCHPCKTIAPFLEGLAEEHAGKVKAVKADIVEANDAAQTYQVVSVPSFLVFIGGRVVNRVTGANNLALSDAFSDAAGMEVGDEPPPEGEVAILRRETDVSFREEEGEEEEEEAPDEEPEEDAVIFRDEEEEEEEGEENDG